MNINRIRKQISRVMAASSSKLSNNNDIIPESKCLFCRDEGRQDFNIHLPYVTSCGHVFCYYCLKYKWSQIPRENPYVWKYLPRLFACTVKVEGSKKLFDFLKIFAQVAQILRNFAHLSVLKNFAPFAFYMVFKFWHLWHFWHRDIKNTLSQLTWFTLKKSVYKINCIEIIILVYKKIIDTQQVILVYNEEFGLQKKNMV